ncbi:RagB/SusD family nutrient uptake outer membrane protein [Pedobacter sp. MC2016-14]|uniref:RagB/SusD family nutrient uptake outer membrane protein n=1 Tax=Pedobacter sp. MC2016-14 TaxID=2897327 RepID=UPI001E646891|nr:RagB/SusD family nutrient uptake outer membrane protein [Pedobacter sp. MC2016-14]MCD0488621.1 RagB/SusD family nutrient uptake outer membrane protein [Pedobacter sp. MC2016-14]
MKCLLFQYVFLFLVISLTSCSKDFLEVKELKSLQVPSTIADFQAIVDYDFGFTGYSAHTLGTNGADEYIITDRKWNSLASDNNLYLRDVYGWSKRIDMIQYEKSPDWKRSYFYIFYANNAISGIQSITPAASEQAAWNNVKGTALFFRAFRYYHLAQQYAFPYKKAEDSPNGLPLRLEPDVTMTVKRSSVHATYKQILSDALESTELLPVLTKRTNYIRPGKAAAYALVAKIYLMMEEYENAAHYADLCLALRGGLIDFNAIGIDDLPIDDFPFSLDYGVSNPEVIYYITSDQSYTNALYTISENMATMEPSQMALYEPGDLRGDVYFRPFRDMDGYRHRIYKGSYGVYDMFSGLATDEIYLIRAECNARINRIDKALQDLNLLLKNRIRTSFFTNITETDPEKLLQMIIKERRKELLFRGTRWEDLRRLNKEARFAKTLVREVAGQRFELPPNDPRYTWPIPQSEVDASGIFQNPR